jgi:hypothetical protein
MPCHVLDHVKALLQMQPEKTKEIRLNNDRPNIHLAVLEMLAPLNSYHDIFQVLTLMVILLLPCLWCFATTRKKLSAFVCVPNHKCLQTMQTSLFGSILG